MTSEGHDEHAARLLVARVALVVELAAEFVSAALHAGPGCSRLVRDDPTLFELVDSRATAVEDAPR